MSSNSIRNDLRGLRKTLESAVAQANHIATTTYADAFFDKSVITSTYRNNEGGAAESANQWWMPRPIDAFKDPDNFINLNDTSDFIGKLIDNLKDGIENINKSALGVDITG